MYMAPVVLAFVRNALHVQLDEVVGEEVEHSVGRGLMGLNQLFDVMGVVWAVEAPAEVAAAIYGVVAPPHDVAVVVGVVH